jgi:hypothetical protein
MMSNYAPNETLQPTLGSVVVCIKPRLAFTEMQKYYKRCMVQSASTLVRDVRVEQFKTWGKPGIRAQLVNLKERKLEMDFRYGASPK